MSGKQNTPAEIDEDLLSDGQILKLLGKLLEPKKGGIEARRARRIRDKQRMKARARRTFEHASASMPYGEQQVFLRGCERLADNLAHCNKRCCNKARFWEGPNIQELRGLAKTDDMMKRSALLLGPPRVDVGREINRRLERRIQQMLGKRNVRTD